MAIIFTADELCKRMLNIANNYKSLYVMGGIGYRLNSSGKQRAMQNSWNTKNPRPSMINAADEHTWAFDCVCVIKAVLWGWVGDESKVYGGAVYASNGVPDIDPQGMISRCSGVSTDFTNIQKGEYLWIQGHAGIYVGDGVVVECTPAWENKVQTTWLGNLPQYKKGNNRIWTKHGKLPWIDYTGVTNTSTDKTTPTTVTTATKDEKGTWDYLLSKIGNEYGVAGLMGNLQAESALSSINLQNSYESKLGYSDVTYTQAVDNGTYKNFVGDAAGYGLAQWTSAGRKNNLYNYCKGKGYSIGSLQGQWEFLIQELNVSYKSVWNTLVNATSIRQASDAVLLKFEVPYDRSDSVQRYRASLGQGFYDKYATGKTSNPTPTTTPTTTSNTNLKSVDEVAKEVIQGKWGNGTARKKNLEAAGYNYSEVQKRVNQLMK